MASHSLLVIKFGGSVLADRSAVPRVVREVSRYLGTHDRIVAVVSAFRNQTNILEHTALSLCHHPAPETLAFYMGLGEMHAAGELALALQGAGIPATLRMPWDVCFLSSGDPLNATPLAVSRHAFENALDGNRVVVFPGYLARGLNGEPQVLGRGGSDLTAIFLAAELKADRCVMLKDAAGVFEWDPAVDGPRPRRYHTISWDDAGKLGGRVLRCTDLEYARARAVTIDVTTLGASHFTRVGGEASTFECADELAPERKRRSHA